MRTNFGHTILLNYKSVEISYMYSSALQVILLQIFWSVLQPPRKEGKTFFGLVD